MNMLEIPNCFHSQLTHGTDKHTYPTTHATRGLFTVLRSRTNTRKHVVLYRTMSARNFLPSHMVQVNSKPGFKKTNKATPHSMTSLPNVTYLLCACTAMYSMWN